MSITQLLNSNSLCVFAACAKLVMVLGTITTNILNISHEEKSS
jgi:hypothetical protein